MPRTHPPYPPEYRRQMVELVRVGNSPEKLADEFEPSAGSPMPPDKPQPSSVHQTGGTPMSLPELSAKVLKCGNSGELTQPLPVHPSHP